MQNSAFARASCPFPVVQAGAWHQCQIVSSCLGGEYGQSHQELVLSVVEGWPAFGELLGITKNAQRIDVTVLNVPACLRLVEVKRVAERRRGLNFKKRRTQSGG